MKDGLLYDTDKRLTTAVSYGWMLFGVYWIAPLHAVYEIAVRHTHGDTISG